MDEFQRRFLPSYSVLRSFESAARHASFTQAAKELNLTQSAISRQVKELESTIGVALFRRVGRRVLLTRAGQKFANDLVTDLGNIRQTVMRAISTGDLSSSLRIAVLPTFACQWLIPKLPNFKARYPQVQVSLSTCLAPVDLEKEHFDLAIHFGQMNWPNADMRLLCSEVMVPVASPTFVKEFGISSLAGLSQTPLLHLASRPTAWHDFFQSVGIEGNSYLEGQYFDQFSMIIVGAKASLGAALVPRYLVEEEIGSRQLKLLSKETFATKNNYFLVCPTGQKSSLVKMFCDWIMSEMRNSPI